MKNSKVSGNHPWADHSNSSLPDGYAPMYVIDSKTNNITVVNDLIKFSNIPGEPSHYDPTTKTIYASYKYSEASGDRLFHDTLKYEY